MLSDSLKRDSRGATIGVEAQPNSFKNSPGRAVLLLTLQRSKASEEHFESDREQCAQQCLTLSRSGRGMQYASLGD